MKREGELAKKYLEFIVFFFLCCVLFFIFPFRLMHVNTQRNKTEKINILYLFSIFKNYK